MNFWNTMVIGRMYDPPDLFLTLTCDPTWPEIADALGPGPCQRPHDRSGTWSVIYSTWNSKDLVRDIEERNVFASIPADTCMHVGLSLFFCPLGLYYLIFSLIFPFAKLYTYEYEFQKGGLPHVHVIVWLSLPPQAKKNHLEDTSRSAFNGIYRTW